MRTDKAATILNTRAATADVLQFLKATRVGRRRAEDERAELERWRQRRGLAAVEA